jgi:(p)ppGpp synthase/HD superfamily hydrolase
MKTSLPHKPRKYNHEDKIYWVLEQHENTNHFYDAYLPYKFHLLMVVQAYEDWKHILNPDLHEDCFLGAYGHDLIEDTRTSYNDAKEKLGTGAADIIYAVTNEKGKNRKERANTNYYQGIRNTPGAVFVKLCDRIANAQYSKMTGSNMFNKYKKEHEHFKYMLYVTGPFEPMWNYLEEIFNSKNEQ